MITKEQAKLMWVNGECVEYLFDNIWNPIDGCCRLDVFDIHSCFRLKPSTIYLNGIEVPTPFEPKEGDMVWCINELSDKGYEARTTYDKDDFIPNIAYWHNEEEIKQVVVALRSVFNVK